MTCQDSKIKGYDYISYKLKEIVEELEKAIKSSTQASYGAIARTITIPLFGAAITTHSDQATYIAIGFIIAQLLLLPVSLRKFEDIYTLTFTRPKQKNQALSQEEFDRYVYETMESYTLLNKLISPDLKSIPIQKLLYKEMLYLIDNIRERFNLLPLDQINKDFDSRLLAMLDSLIYILTKAKCLKDSDITILQSYTNDLLEIRLKITRRASNGSDQVSQ